MTNSFEATVQLVPTSRLEASIINDLASSFEAVAEIYSLQPRQFRRLYGTFLTVGHLHVICHHTALDQLHELAALYPNLHVNSWTRNRIMHAKVLCIPDRGISYIGSHNTTRYSFSSGLNRMVRVESHPFAAHLLHQMNHPLVPLRNRFALNLVSTHADTPC